MPLLGRGPWGASQDLGNSDNDEDMPWRKRKRASPGLQKLAKNPRGNLGAKVYDGNLNPVIFNTWRESLYNTYNAYDIEDDEEQV